MQFCFCNSLKILFTNLQFLKSNKYILVFLNILLFQFDLRDIHIQLFMSKLTNSSKLFYTAKNWSTTLNKTLIIVKFSYTVISVNRIFFISLNTFSLSLDFKLKMNSLYLYDDLDAAIMYYILIEDFSDIESRD